MRYFFTGDDYSMFDFFKESFFMAQAFIRVFQYFWHDQLWKNTLPFRFSIWVITY